MSDPALKAWESAEESLALDGMPTGTRERDFFMLGYITCELNSAAKERTNDAR